LVLKDIFVVW